MQKKIILSLLFFVTCSWPCFADLENKPYVIVRCEHQSGFFRVMASVVGLLHLYENGQYSGLKVDFLNKGLYFDEKEGPNWWEYFFEPLEVGVSNKGPLFITANGPMECDCAMLTEFRLLRKRVNQLITKYIHPKAFIKKKVEAFVKKYFKSHSIIGVHYRGTDKGIEAPQASYENVLNIILQEIRKQGKKTRLFVATDELSFLKAIKSAFPGRVIYTKGMRSSNGEPVHKITGNGFQRGEEALIDCLLLSHCDLIIKTSSNLSLFSTYFNPDVPVIHLTTRHGKTALE